MRRPRIHALAAVLLTGCAAAPAPKVTTATPAAEPCRSGLPCRGASAAAFDARHGPELPAVPSATALPSNASTPASKQELVEIAQRFNEASTIPGAARTPVAPEAFRIEDLPTITVPEPLDVATAPTQSGGDPATELFVDWKSSTRALAPIKSDTYTSVRVSVNGVTGGKLRIGHTEGTVTRDGGGGPWVSCGGVPSSLRKLVPARWEVTLPTAKGGVEYHIVNAWFDTQTCTAAIVARASVPARRLAGGMLYAFRQHAASPAQQDDTLALIGPRFAHLATSAVGGDPAVAVNEVSRIQLPLRRGGGASVMGRVAASTARDWGKLTGLSPVTDNDLVVGVEITQGVEDPSPLAVAYLGVSVATKTAPVGQNKSKSELVDPFTRK